MDRDRNFALQQITYEPLKELLQGFLTCKERGTLFTRGIRFNVPNLTGHDCELDTSRTANGRPTFSSVLLPVGRRPSDHISIPQSPLGEARQCKSGSFSGVEKSIAFLKDNSRQTVENQDDLFKLGVDSVDYGSLGIRNLE